MKLLTSALLAITLLSCAASPKKPTEVSKPVEYRARITYYTAYENDGYGSKVACQKTKIARLRETVSAHPDFKFGTKISIPALKKEFGDEHFVVHDRGSHVTKKKASKGKTYVFDVYVSSNAVMRRLARTMPEYTTVLVHQ